MGKLLRVRDILLLTLAGIGDVAQELRDPMQIMGKSYEAMYGFIPKRYKRNNFLQTVGRSLKTGDIEKIIKDDKVYLRLTSTGKNRIHRDFPILNLTKKWNKHWVIVVFDISEKSKSIRNNFRNKIKSLGFGMLQESVWISPLSIGEDMREFIDSIGLSEHVFVMEISGFILGDPRQLVQNVWSLERYEEECFRLKTKIENINQLIKNESDRIGKNEAKRTKDHMNMRYMEVENDVKNYEKDFLNDYEKDYVKTHKKNYAKNNAKDYLKDYLNKLLRKRREIMKEKLEFLVNFPAIPWELLPKSLRFHLTALL